MELKSQTSVSASRKEPKLYGAELRKKVPTAFGVKAVVEHLERNGIRAERHVAIGGIPRKSPFVMQMLADVTGKTFEVCSTGDACALGAAMHAAVAAGLYGNVAEAQERMCAPSCATYSPQPALNHDARYAIYKAMA